MDKRKGKITDFFTKKARYKEEDEEVNQIDLSTYIIVVYFSFVVVLDISIFLVHSNCYAL